MTKRMDSALSLIDTGFWVTCGAILLLLILSAFFSGSETALTAASRGKLKARAEEGRTWRRARARSD